MKLRNEARHLKAKAINSMRCAMTAFNSPHDDGRVTTVLLHLQHAFEMILKAGLVQNRVKVFDPESGRSIGFERCLHESAVHPSVKLSQAEAGTLRAIDAMRDDEQHWFTIVDEGLLYLHLRAGVTLFDDLLDRLFAERLADHLPVRVLPIGTEPPQEFQVLVDREYANIAELLKPNRRAQAEASARIRALLAMEAHTEGDTAVSATDVRRVMRGIAEGKGRQQVFPKLGHIGATVSGDGLAVEVRFVKKDAMPVRLVRDGEEVDAAAIRVVDLQKKYHRTATALASSIGLTAPKARALRIHLGIDQDESCVHTFNFESQKLVRYSDNAFTRMRDALKTVDMQAIWKSHGAHRGSASAVCTQVGCVAISKAS